jgi:hypothetical protein
MTFQYKGRTVEIVNAEESIDWFTARVDGKATDLSGFVAKLPKLEREAKQLIDRLDAAHKAFNKRHGITSEEAK